MPFNLPKYNFQFVRNNQAKNNTDLLNNSSKSLSSSPNTIYSPSYKLLYDSGWVNSVNESISGAITQVENLPLPEKAKFEFTFTVNVPESYLPFINTEIFTQLTDSNQYLRGVEKYTYSGLQEVLLQLYDWNGVTQTTAVLDLSPENPADDGYGYWTAVAGPIPISLPAGTLTIPPPTGCYTRHTYFTFVYVPSIGSGLGPFRLNADGSLVEDVPGHWISYTQFVQNLFDTYHPAQINLYLTAGQSVDFNHQYLNFPVPIDGASTLPCGSITPPPGYPNQYWESTNIVSFQQYLDLGYSYEDTAELFLDYYPDIYITPFENGEPYKAYKRISGDIVQSAKKTVQINKINDNTFYFKVYGYLLLFSPANVETSWSDPSFPTYQPQSLPILINLRAYLNGHPIKLIDTKEYLK